MRRDPCLLLLPLILVAAAIVFFSGIHWGLPTHNADPFLFGERKPWTGKQIIELAGGWEDQPDVGADVARNPLAGRDRVLVVNDTDAKRAQIVRRYRLFSYQPDEASTLRALAEIKPSHLQFDPKLYQYGGLWVYPIGGLLQVASMLHLVQLRGDVAYYLDHPEEFGKFYIIARAYSALWAVIGVATVFTIVRRLTGQWPVALAAGACFAVMPVVMNMSHEAKPHLPGAVLMLLTVLAGSRYVETGKRSWWMAAGGLCGAAIGMVLSCLPVIAVIPIMVLLRPSQKRAKVTVLISSAALAGIVYCITNPYVPINCIWHPQVLRSNLGNSSAMYHPQPSVEGILTTVKLIAVGASPLVAIAGIVGIGGLAVRAWRVRGNREPAEVARRAVGLLLAAPALWVIAQCLLVAAGKPGEFGRFLILPDVFLMVEAFVAVTTFLRKPVRAGVLLTVLWTSTAIPGMLYLNGFVRDCRPRTTRIQLAEHIMQLNRGGARNLKLTAEPAPYCLPPVDLWAWRIQLLPHGNSTPVRNGSPDALIQTADVVSNDLWDWMFGTPISWANKPFKLASGVSDSDH